jgi:hypothetical protein
MSISDWIIFDVVPESSALLGINLRVASFSNDHEGNIILTATSVSHSEWDWAIDEVIHHLENARTQGHKVLRKTQEAIGGIKHE